MLSIRQEDLRTLAVIYDTSAGQLADIVGWGVLDPAARRSRTTSRSEDGLRVAPPRPTGTARLEAPPAKDHTRVGLTLAGARAAR